MRIRLSKWFNPPITDPATETATATSPEPPLRRELYSLDQLQRHARGLAQRHHVAPRRDADPLLPRLVENERVLYAYNEETMLVEKRRRVTPAAEWILDNFYLIEEQIRTVRRHLPRGYNRELPHLTTGSNAGFPRVYDLALELIAHVDGRLDVEHLQGFVAAYQLACPLKLGELWAIPIMLRLALLENLRRVTVILNADRRDRDLANEWTDRMMSTAEGQPEKLIVVVAQLAEAELALTRPFVAEFWRRIHGKTPLLQLPLSWLEQRLSAEGLTLEHLIQSESQSQASHQVSVGNTITSLRFLNVVDWREFVESLSVVEKTLRAEPSQIYGRMDFFSRDLYRHAVEDIAKRSTFSEPEVAAIAVDLAREAGAEAGRRQHVGHFLIGEGTRQLESATRVRRSLSLLLHHWRERHPLALYVGAIISFTGLIAVLLLEKTVSEERPVWISSLLAVLSLVGVSHLAVLLVNWLVTIFVEARALPRLDFSKGIPDENATLVVVPTLLTSLSDIDELLEDLEIRYLANRDPNLHFALLTDFPDAAAEQLPADEPALERIRTGVEALNQKYESDRPGIFFLLHRPRRWNEAEGVWMGEERKRGKLGDLNALLRGRGEDRFSTVSGDVSNLTRCRYVITLDTDTQLPHDAARAMIGTMAHPLNRPHFDPQLGRVTRGYGILQPRAEVSLANAGRSWFVKLFSGDLGLDPYTRVVSDVYQDLFQEGSFIGKGIYDVDAFEAATGGRFPNNRILSHDLLEGSYVRAGLLTDVELYEGMPATYPGDISRRHRWVRGDWQIASWLLPRVPSPQGVPVRNNISGLSRWKIFDNLRRSLVPAALTALLLIGWFQSDPKVNWALLVYAVLLIPVGLWLVGELCHKSEEASWPLHLRRIAHGAGTHVAQALLALAFLPYEALVNLDAIGRTLWRLGVSRQRLLQWQTARQGERRPSQDLLHFYRQMAIAPLLAVGMGAYLISERPHGWVSAWPLLCLWLGAPALAWAISRPIPPRPNGLSHTDLTLLRSLARQTWSYFETFVNAEENWLPPDNFQEQPHPVVAARTSPTNIGMSLLANLSAADFGFISVGRLLERTDLTLTTMEKLEGHRGHFYNWYETRTLRPLLPLYVSTVDSGNLAGNLLVLRPGLTELVDQPLVPPNVWAGLAATLEILRSVSLTADRDAGSQLQRLQELLAAPTTDPAAAVEVLGRFLNEVAILRLPIDAAGEITRWRQALERDCRDHRDDLLYLAPWVALGTAPAAAAALPEVAEVLSALSQATTLRRLAGLAQSALPLLGGIEAERSRPKEVLRWLGQLRAACTLASDHASQRIRRVEDLVQRCGELADMDFTFLYDAGRHLFSIGFNVAAHRLDDSFYDLLASEARLASYVAIALGQVQQEHWFALGRLLTSSGAKPLLISWSGSMFEYLMPLLVMPTYEGTLLDSTYKAAVGRQIEYGQHRGVPWGLSESGYYLTDAQMNFQYRAFGVPGLGFKRGLADDIVVAPYASVMALMVEPEAACRNIQRLVEGGFLGSYGLYEAIDYTPARLAPGQAYMLVSSFMAHHQGMSLLALTYLLLNRPMQRRFQSNPLFKAAELLLQERVPKEGSFLYPHEIEVTSSRQTVAPREAIMRVFTKPGASLPEVHLLSNGRYHVMVSSAGCGYSRWKDLALTRWREDPTRDGTGTFLYLRDVESGKFWSAGFHPTRHQSKHYEAIFSQGRAEFRDRQSDLDLHTEICVSPEDDIEVRRLTVSNRSRSARRIEFTTYSEVVLAAPGADAAHPAFSNLFVQTEIVPRWNAILCTRRPRAPEEVPPWMFHLVLLTGTEQGEATFETDRSRFIGRGRSSVAPAAMQNERLSNSQGSVLDPIVAVRRTASVGPEETVRFISITGIAETRAAAERLMEKYHDAFLAERVIELAWTHGLVVLRQLNATEPEAQLFGRLASALVYMNRHRRAHPSVLSRNRRGQSGLWSFGISGDLPILLLFSTNAERLPVVAELLQAHAYWRMKGLTVDLVIVITEESGYRQSLYDSVVGLIASGLEAHMMDKPGGLFVRRVDQLSDEDRILLQAVARVVLHDENGGLAEQLERPILPEPAIPALNVSRTVAPEMVPLKLPRRELLFFNGLGGFTSDGREYVIMLEPGQATPAPWVNVLANERFGTVVTDHGHAYSWFENSHEFRLTPWYNDPVTDLSGEALYIRDEQTGQFWSPSPGPARGQTPYVVRHGFGYSVFEHEESGIASELTVFVGLNAPVKFLQLKLRNTSSRPRSLSVTGYWEWVLGELRPKTMLHVQTEVDPRSGALFARNPYNSDFPDRIAFVDSIGERRTFTGSRTEFIGHNGTLASPAAMRRSRLSGRVGAGLDPCAALQTVLSLAPGEEREVVFRLGAGRDAAEAQQLIHHLRGPGMTQQSLEAVWEYWKVTLGQVHIETPDPAVNVLANGWLLYQTLACRIWARTGFYQSGGAYGFRDQLQDSMALVHADPRVLRQHLLRAARHQFREGDVQHWWHPPVGRGVRTHFSDDYLWLPYATCRYVRALNDTGVLDEQIPFLEGRPVPPEVEAYYDLHRSTEDTATLYEHCVRAIKNGFRWGAHGLPLIGCGDWNDGMNLIGAGGKGESVWLAFFFHDVLRQFAPVARQRGDVEFADLCEAKAKTLQENIEKNAWDGQWYRRAYFDDGEPLGSATNPECQIDALPQSWSVIAQVGDPKRSRQAMEAVDKRLVRRDAGLIQLFDPPFDKSSLQPGYIKGYVPGVRENGGQYTHAAIWTIMAFAMEGEQDRAWELFALINPVQHGDSASRIQTYKVEPYVVAADVYAVSPHIGRGGWTWYTGSAGWLYRLVTETLLGLEKEGDVLRIHPRPRSDWSSFKIHYRFYETFYHITAARAAEGTALPNLTVDGQEQPDGAIRLQNDRQHHNVEVWF